MNKKVIGFLLAVPALMGFGLTSCSDEESIAGATGQDKLVEVNVTASLADMTRASLTPDKNIIKFEWEVDDEITVVNAGNGKFLGTLKVSKLHSDHRVCDFKGSAAIPAGKVNLNFYYLGKDQKPSFAQDLTVNDYPVDFSNQDGTASFSANDILISTGEYNDVQDGDLGMVNFNRNFAYGRFILKYNGKALDLAGKTVTISANTGKLYNKTALNFQTATYASEEGVITVKPTTNDFYVSFLPTDAVNLKFVVDEFDGTKGEKLVADTYYTADAEGEPIVVEMRHSDGSDDKHDYKLTYKSNYEGGPADANFSWNEVSPYNYTVRTYQQAFDSKNEGLDLTREGYEFTGWNTQADGKGTSYAAGADYTVTTENPNGVLYAQWKEAKYYFQFNWIDKPEDGDGFYGAVLNQGTSPCKLKSAVPAENPNSTYYKSNVKEGYKFLYWEFNGSKVSGTNPIVGVKSGETVKIESTGLDVYKVYIYAVWQKLYSVNWYDGYTTPQTPLNDEPVYVENPANIPAEATPANPTRDGFTFAGWDKVVNDTNKTVVFTAKWDKNPDPTVTTPGYGHGDFAK